ncbi:unnamed protein product, partial [Laminaria digitata]
LNPVNFDIGLILSYSCVFTTGFYQRLLIATIGPLAGLAALAGTYSIATANTFRQLCLSHLFIYSSVSFVMFRTFVCDKLDDGVTYLRDDYSLMCTTAEHSAYEVYASLMVVVYSVGIPAVFSWWLFCNRRGLQKPDRESLTHLKPWDGLWAAYVPSRFYFEIVESARRIALTGVAMFVLPDSAAHSTVG